MHNLTIFRTLLFGSTSFCKIDHFCIQEKSCTLIKWSSLPKRVTKLTLKDLVGFAPGASLVLANFRLGRKVLTVTNDLAYLSAASKTKKTNFLRERHLEKKKKTNFEGENCF
jgi:hypothetical protein